MDLEEQINAAMAVGDLDSLDKLIEQAESGEPNHEDQSKSSEAEISAGKKVEASGTTPETGTEQENASSDNTATNENDANGSVKEIASKDGKHTIPYEVLDNARKNAQELRGQVESLKGVEAERDKLKAILEKNGIDINASQVDKATDEELAELANDFPVVGKQISKLLNEIAELKANAAKPSVVQTSEPTVEDVNKAFETIPELVKWRDTAPDQDRLEYAILKDAELVKDPMWASKPLTERFAEAVRRTQSAFGDDVTVGKQQSGSASKPTQTPNQNQKKPEDSGLPNSPSELGNGVREVATKGTPEYYASLSSADLAKEFERLPQAEIDRIVMML